LLVTQQPGSIPVEILSQGDNWFIFHLLSAADLNSLSKANAHFSTDLLSALLNEPIPGQSVFWSSVSGKPYPIPVRVLSFEKLYSPQDTAYNKMAVTTFATALRQRFLSTATALAPAIPIQPRPDYLETRGELFFDEPEEQELDSPTTGDVLAEIEQNAAAAVRANSDIWSKINGDGVAWGALKALIMQHTPASMDDRDQLAFRMVPKVLDRLFGSREWHTLKVDRNDKRITYVKVGRIQP
jgi:uncharacterized protein